MPPQAPPKGGDVQVRKYFAENYQIKSPALISRVRIGTPLPSEGSGEAVGAGGGFCISLCKTDSYKGICGTCYSSTPKNDCFLNKVAYLCKQKRKSPTRPPRKGRRQVCKYFAENYLRKESKVLILLCAHRHSSPFGEAGWGFSSSPKGEGSE